LFFFSIIPLLYCLLCYYSWRNKGFHILHQLLSPILAIVGV